MTDIPAHREQAVVPTKAETTYTEIPGESAEKQEKAPDTKKPRKSEKE